MCALLVVVRVDGTTSAAAAGDDSVGDPGRAGVAMGGVGRALWWWWCWWWFMIECECECESECVRVMSV